MDYSPNGGLQTLSGNSSWGTGTHGPDRPEQFVYRDQRRGWDAVDLERRRSRGAAWSKLGTGTLILSGSAANTYNANTIVTAGTLQLSKTAAVAAVLQGNLVIQNGATVQINAATARSRRPPAFACWAARST